MLSLLHQSQRFEKFDNLFLEAVTACHYTQSFYKIIIDLSVLTLNIGRLLPLVHDLVPEYLYQFENKLIIGCFLLSSCKS